MTQSPYIMSVAVQSLEIGFSIPKKQRKNVGIA